MSCLLVILVKITSLFKKDKQTTWELPEDRIDFSLLDSTTTDTTLESDEERRKKEQLKKEFTSGDPFEIVLGESNLNPMEHFPKYEDTKLVFTSETTTNKSAIDEEEKEK